MKLRKTKSAVSQDMAPIPLQDLLGVMGGTCCINRTVTAHEQTSNKACNKTFYMTEENPVF